MSHYTVLVINTKGEDDLEQQLAPYDENIQVEEYEDGIVSDADKTRFLQFYIKKELDEEAEVVSETQKMTDELEEVASKGDLPVKVTGTSRKEVEDRNSIKVNLDEFEEYYKKYGDDWNGNDWRLEDGVWKIFSTYSPESKWDWYQIGGRWAGSLPIKKEYEKDKTLNFSWGWDDDSIKEKKAKLVTDRAFKYQIDWDALTGKGVAEAQKSKYMRDFEILAGIRNPETPNEEEMLKRCFYKEEYYLERYKDAETYAQEQMEFATYALLVDGQWYEPGQMGWWGMSDETYDSVQEYRQKFWEILESAPDNALFTVVDCHI